MHASSTTVALATRARAVSGTNRVDTRSGWLRNAAARTAPDDGGQYGPEVASANAADADYFVHPFVD